MATASSATVTFEEASVSAGESGPSSKMGPHKQRAVELILDQTSMMALMIALTGKCLAKNGM
jgi:hypothetical protein